MTKINFAEELRKQGFKLTHLPPPIPEQMEVEVVGEIDPQKLSPAQRRVYDVVNDYSKKLQAARQRPVPHFVVAQHGQRRSSVLNTQKQR